MTFNGLMDVKMFHYLQKNIAFVW